MSDYEVEFEGHRSNPSLRDMQRHTYLDIDDDPMLDDLVYDNEVISKLEDADVVIDLTVDTEVEESVEQVIEEAEAIVRETIELSSFVGIMTAQDFGHEIFNNTGSHDPGRYERWSQVPPPPGKGEPLKRERPRLPRHDIPAPNPRESRSNDWRRPVKEPTEDVIIDVRETEPVVIMPPSERRLERRPRGNSEAHQEAPKPQKNFLKRVVNRIQDVVYDSNKVEKLPRPDIRKKVLSVLGGVAVIGLTLGAYMNTNSSSNQANATSETLKGQAPVVTQNHDIKPMETIPWIANTDQSIYSTTRNAQYREFYHVDHDLSEVQMNDLDLNFANMVAWSQNNDGDFSQALNNFYK